MTDLLEKALTEIRKLPDTEQDALAAMLLQELESERRWTDAFAASQDALERLAQEALGELRADQAKPL